MRKCLPKIALLLVFVMIITGIVLAMDEPVEPVKEAPEAAQAEVLLVPFTAETPVAMTTPGQAPEIAMVSLLARRMNFEIKSENFLKPKDLEGMKTLIIILGASGKGLGAAGVDLQAEVQRANELIATCKEKGIKIIGMHLGGKDRLGENSMVMINLVTPKCDYVLIRSDGNKDGLFTKICLENNIPLKEIEKTTEASDVIKAVFGL